MTPVETRQNPLLGIVGGMGPFASVEFLKTIYECGVGQREQDAPVVMYSDPTFPDRTEEFLMNSSQGLLERLARALDQLTGLGASEIIICCITLHYLLPKLKECHRRKILSLVDVIFDNITSAGTGHLLMCTKGSRTLRLFQGHEMWERCKEYVVLPDNADQEVIHHGLIYEIKRNVEPRRLVPLVESLLRKYGVKSFIVGCTDIHILAKELLREGKGWGCIDPLIIVAKRLTRG
jgi:aspartate racemase